MKTAVENVDPEILDTLKELKRRDIRVGLISNADRIDCKYWTQSKLSTYFDDAIFSCDVGLLKPEAAIYELAVGRMGVKAEESLFVGDGGSRELKGVKKANMRTVLTEYLDRKEEKERESTSLSLPRVSLPYSFKAYSKEFCFIFCFCNIRNDDAV